MNFSNILFRKNNDNNALITNSFYNKMRNKNIDITYNIDIHFYNNIYEYKKLSYIQNSSIEDEAYISYDIYVTINGLKQKYIFNINIQDNYDIHFYNHEYSFSDISIKLYEKDINNNNIIYNDSFNTLLNESDNINNDNINNEDNNNSDNSNDNNKDNQEFNNDIYELFDKLIDNIDKTKNNIDKYKYSNNINSVILYIIYEFIFYYDDFYYYKFYDKHPKININHILSNIKIIKHGLHKTTIGGY
jgi:hypothetical protein